MAAKEYTLPELVREVAREMNIEEMLKTPEGMAAVTSIVNQALKDLEAKLTSEIAEERKLRTAAEEGLAELRDRLQRRETFDRDYGMHRGLDGKIKPNVSRQAAETIFNLVRGLATKNMDAVRAVSTTTNSEGGFLVATEVATEVLRFIPEMGLYPSLARQFPLGTGKMDIGTVLSQMGAYWPGENNAITATFPTFGKVSLEGKLCGAFIPVPMQLMSRASAEVGQLIADLIREAILKEIDRVAIIGKSVANGGTDVFDGIINASGIVAVPLGTNKTHISDVDPDILLTMQTAIPEGSRSDCGYLMEESVLDNVRKVKTSTGDYVSGHFYTPPTGAEPAKLWGKPVYTTSRMPAYSTTSQPSTRFITYGSYRQWALYGNEQDLAIASSDVAGETFKNVQIAIRGITTVGVAAFGPAFAVLETASS